MGKWGLAPLTCETDLWLYPFKCEASNIEPLSRFVLSSRRLVQLIAKQPIEPVATLASLFHGFKYVSNKWNQNRWNSHKRTNQGGQSQSAKNAGEITAKEAQARNDVVLFTPILTTKNGKKKGVHCRLLFAWKRKRRNNTNSSPKLLNSRRVDPLATQRAARAVFYFLTG